MIGATDGWETEGGGRGREGWRLGGEATTADKARRFPVGRRSAREGRPPLDRDETTAEASWITREAVRSLAMHPR